MSFQETERERRSHRASLFLSKFVARNPGEPEIKTYQEAERERRQREQQIDPDAFITRVTQKTASKILGTPEGLLIKMEANGLITTSSSNIGACPTKFIDAKAIVIAYLAIQESNKINRRTISYRDFDYKYLTQKEKIDTYLSGKKWERVVARAKDY